MSDYSIGDYVLIRGKVIAVHGSDIGYSVELFSKTDQYAAMVRPDLVVGGTSAPQPDEPDTDSLVVDSEGDVWRWRDGVWKLRPNDPSSPGITWAQLIDGYSPVRIYEATS